MIKKKKETNKKNYSKADGAMQIPKHVITQFHALCRISKNALDQ